jgi:phosphoserine phosphatase
VGIQNWVANGLITDENGLLKGEGVFRVDLRRKDRALTDLLKSLGVGLPEVVSVGDSKYDLSMMKVCGGGIAFIDGSATEDSLEWTKGWCKVPTLSQLPEAVGKLVHLRNS